MSEDYRVPKRSDNEVREEANQTKQAYGVVDHRRPVNIIRCLQSGWIPTRQGRRKLVYNVVDDEDMGGKDGRTEFTRDAVIISVKRGVNERANWGDGRSRMTLAHELAHGVMHYGATVFRASSAMGTTELSRGSAAGSAEHQAKVFAAAFLIDDEVAAKLESAEEISSEFGVSLEAAKICFDRLTEAADRARSAERVRQSNEAFQASKRKPAQQFSYTGDFCARCGNATLIPMGVKLLCHTCGDISDPL
jgi:hypothetical protein